LLKYVKPWRCFEGYTDNKKRSCPKNSNSLFALTELVNMNENKVLTTSLLAMDFSYRA